MTTIIRSVIESAIIGYLIYLSIYDIRHHKVTNKSVLMFLPVVMLKCTYEVCVGTLYDYLPMILGAAAGFSVLLITAIITHGGIGGGDIKLMFLFGLVLGFPMSIITIFLATFIAFPIALIILFSNKENVIPFGPFLSMAAMIIYISGVEIMDILNFLIK